MANINSTIRRIAAEQARRDSKALPKSHTKREKSLTESLTEYHPPNYGLHFCLHDKTYYEPCLKCRRSNLDAKRNLLSL